MNVAVPRDVDEWIVPQLVVHQRHACFGLVDLERRALANRGEQIREARWIRVPVAAAVVLEASDRQNRRAGRAPTSGRSASAATSARPTPLDPIIRRSRRSLARPAPSDTRRRFGTPSSATTARRCRACSSLTHATPDTRRTTSSSALRDALRRSRARPRHGEASHSTRELADRSSPDLLELLRHFAGHHRLPIRRSRVARARQCLGRRDWATRRARPCAATS